MAPGSPVPLFAGEFSKTLAIFSIIFGYPASFSVSLLEDRAKDPLGVLVRANLVGETGHGLVSKRWY